MNNEQIPAAALRTEQRREPPHTVVRRDNCFAKFRLTQPELPDPAAYWRLSDSDEPLGPLPEADYYLVERYADWCNPCRRFMEDFPGWVADHEQDVVLIKLDLMPAQPGQDSPPDE